MGLNLLAEVTVTCKEWNIKIWIFKWNKFCTLSLHVGFGDEGCIAPFGAGPTCSDRLWVMPVV
jgi:hypothetical protein